MWMKTEHSWMNFIHDYVNIDTCIDVGDNDDEHDVKNVIYDNHTISYL